VSEEVQQDDVAVRVGEVVQELLVYAEVPAPAGRMVTQQNHLQSQHTDKF
jgi:hypothetical protein